MPFPKATATRVKDGRDERRCSHPRHVGERWLPATPVYYYVDKYRLSRYCVACKRADALLRYHAGKPRPATPVYDTPEAVRDLEQATAAWPSWHDAELEPA
jgi:hypothetical protein